MQQLQHRGFVLLIVLVFLQLFTLLSAQYLWSKTRIKQEIKLQLAVMAAHDQALDLLDTWGAKKRVCESAHYTTRFLQGQPESWWQLHACDQIRELHVYWLQEDIMTDACMAVSSAPQMRVHYYRRTIFIAGLVGAIAQETVATSDAQPVDCAQPIKLIAPGRQSLRWLR